MTSPGRTVALVTCARFPELAPDDRLLQVALAEQGIFARPAVWDDAEVPWTSFDAVVVRSCWDYHLRPREFLSWIDRLEQGGTKLWNPASLLRWNADKFYLRALTERGVRVVPTRWVGAGEDPSLGDILREEGWDQAVVKPTISASAHNTWRTERSQADSDQPRFIALARAGGVMVQPFLQELATAGEWSLVYFGGRFSHAVRKQPRDGDFRVQGELGGSHLPLDPGVELVREADAVLREVPVCPLYARVDGPVIAGRFMLMEVELLEPQLYLGSAPGAARRFATEIAARMPATEAPGMGMPQ